MVPYLGTHPRKLHCSHQLSPSPLHLSSPAAPQPFLRFNAQHWAEQGRSWWARTAWTGAKTNPTPAYLSAMGCPPLVSILYPLEGKGESVHPQPTPCRGRGTNVCFGNNNSSAFLLY